MLLLMLRSLIHFLIFLIYNSAGSHYPVIKSVFFRSKLFQFETTAEAVCKSIVLFVVWKIVYGFLGIILASCFRWIVSFFKSTNINWCCACCYTCDNYRMIYTFLLNVPNYNKWNIVSFGVKTASLQPYWLHSNALMMRGCLNCRKDIFSQKSYLKRLVSCSFYHVFPVQI